MPVFSVQPLPRRARTLPRPVRTFPAAQLKATPRRRPRRADGASQFHRGEVKDVLATETKSRQWSTPGQVNGLPCRWRRLFLTLRIARVGTALKAAVFRMLPAHQAIGCQVRWPRMPVANRFE